MTEESSNVREELVGLVLDNKYRIERLVGSGGMGSVYEAYHTGIDRKLAIKVLHLDAIDDEGVILRFQREARITGALGHENIILVTDTGQTPAGAPYIVMEYLEGQDLGDLLHETGPMDLSLAMQIMIPVLDALVAVHEAGVIHRDLKPDNIFLAKQNRVGKKTKTVVKLLDFGISKPTSVDCEAQSLTQTGNMVGTPLYMSPEQIRAREIDLRSDIYSVGVILYELLTGRRPFNGETFGDLCASILVDEPPPLTLYRNDLPKGLDVVVYKAIARDADDRFASVGELLEALEPFSPPGLVSSVTGGRYEDFPTPSHQRESVPSKAPSVTSPQKVSKSLIWGAIGVVAAALGTFAVAWFMVIPKGDGASAEVPARADTQGRDAGRNELGQEAESSSVEPAPSLEISANGRDADSTEPEEGRTEPEEGRTEPEEVHAKANDDRAEVGRRRGRKGGGSGRSRVPPPPPETPPPASSEPVEAEPHITTIDREYPPGM